MTRVLGWLAVVGLAGGLIAAFGYAPREAVQGNVQRIMYIHVPSVLTAYLAFALVLVGSIAYLATRRRRWDRLAAASGEIGVLFTALTIASGSIWGSGLVYGAVVAIFTPLTPSPSPWFPLSPHRGEGARGRGVPPSYGISLPRMSVAPKPRTWSVPSQ